MLKLLLLESLVDTGSVDPFTPVMLILQVCAPAVVVVFEVKVTSAAAPPAILNPVTVSTIAVPPSTSQLKSMLVTVHFVPMSTWMRQLVYSWFHTTAQKLPK